MIGQRDKALDAMRSYQEQCDCLRGDLANREQKLEEQMERVSFLKISSIYLHDFVICFQIQIKSILYKSGGQAHLPIFYP